MGKGLPFCGSGTLTRNTAAASVSGTVAWFTAAKIVTATAGSFQASYNDSTFPVTDGSWMATINKLGSALDQTILSIPTEGKDVTVTEDVTFTDASYDLATDTLYSDIQKTMAVHQINLNLKELALKTIISG